MQQQPIHPFKRIRESLKKHTRPLNLARYSTASGFAKLIGRSESLIRNVEAGATKISLGLALQVESKTGVSSAWLQGPDALTGEILAKDGTPWDPTDYLDPYAKGTMLANVAAVLKVEPELVPALVGRMVEARIRMETQTKRDEDDSSRGRKEKSTREMFDGKPVLREVLKLLHETDAIWRLMYADYVSEAFESIHPIDKLKATWTFISTVRGYRTDKPLLRS
jgi:hypothetical protein